MSDPSNAVGLTDLEKAQLEKRKLELEIQKLRREGSAFGIFSGTLIPISVAAATAFAALLGAWIAGTNLNQQAENRSADAHDKSLQEALSMATDDKSGSDRRIS